MVLAQEKTKRLVWSLVSLLFLVTVFVSFAVLSERFPTLLLSSRVSPVEYTQLKLSAEEKDDLKRLGLTPKNPVEVKNPLTGEKRTIHGRFLHLTDFHPDPYYKPGLSIEDKCHGGKGEASKYGDAILGCDAPLDLVFDTIDWVESNLKDKIDFIVWTGDNVRHDNDREYPRFETDIFESNEKISRIMYEKFDILPIPSLGNNDVYPHNLFAEGPTLQTREFYKIWRPYVPQPQLHLFNKGAYFFQEVIPGQLAVLSINTLYLYKSNPLVDSCDKKKDPGYKIFKWLGYVLKEMRRRNMKVWLTGHVPPTPKNYDISCLRKYIMWAHEYRDVIIGGLYGHMNIDHFVPLDSKMAYESFESKFKEIMRQDDFKTFEEDDEGEDVTLEKLYEAFNSSIQHDSIKEAPGVFDFSKDIHVEAGVPKGKVDYMNTFRETMYADIKRSKKCGKLSERYSVAHVSASVVPTFNPGLRVWEYNITDLHNIKMNDFGTWDSFFSSVDYLLEKDDGADYHDSFATFNDKVDAFKKDKTIPPKMPKDLPLGPAYDKQLFTPERYVQYFLDLEGINEGKKKFEYELEYSTDNDAYNMKDLTVNEWLHLGRRLGAPVRQKRKGADEKEVNSPKLGKKLDALWKQFLKHTFIDSNYENLGYGFE